MPEPLKKALSISAPELKLTGEFVCPHLEQLYREYNAQHNRARMTGICIMTAIAYFSGLAVDWSAMGNSGPFWVMVWGRLVCLGFGFAAAYSAWRLSLRTVFPIWMIAYMCLLGLNESVEVIFLARISHDLTLPVVLIIVLMYYLFIPVRAAIAILPSLFMSVLYWCAITFWTDMGVDHSILLLCLFLVANGYGVVHFSSFSRLQRREFAALIEQRRLNEELQKVNCELQKEVAIRQAAEANLRQLATTDGLTGINNRRHLMALLTEEMTHVDQSLSLIMMDVDHFKSVNDTYGHPVGDLVLKTLAQTVQSQLRSWDRVGRFGGEEFIAFLPHTTLAQAYQVAERIRLCIAQVLITPPTQESFHITISLGVATLTHDVSTLDSLIKAADTALYQAKHSGRNRTVSMEVDESPPPICGMGRMG